jgi:hypothetical protein
LRAAAEIGAASVASRIARNRSGDDVATARAARHFREARHRRRAAFEGAALGLFCPRFDAIGRRLGRLWRLGAALGRPAIAL